MHNFHFTFNNLKSQYKKAIDLGYQIITCLEYARNKEKYSDSKIIINRVDIDLSLKKARRLVEIYNELSIKGSFFLRLHAPEYNPLSFESYLIVKEMINSGHELGYHSEIVDQSIIWNEDPEDCLKRDISTLESFFETRIFGVASHGGMSGLNNLDFWKSHKPKDFGLAYEAYDEEPEFNLFANSFYISDSEWTRWKCYNNGKLLEGDNRSLSDHLEDGHRLIYLLIHSDTYFDRHFYE